MDRYEWLEHELEDRYYQRPRKIRKNTKFILNHGLDHNKKGDNKE